MVDIFIAINFLVVSPIAFNLVSKETGFLQKNKEKLGAN